MLLITKADPDLVREGVLEIEHAGRLVHTHTEMKDWLLLLWIHKG